VTLVDGVHQNLADFVEDFVTEPTTMPWGNRSLLFRDPDGNLVNFFTSVTTAANGHSVAPANRRACSRCWPGPGGPEGRWAAEPVMPEPTGTGPGRGRETSARHP
jgi:hypothetical protein